jgi:hypothetical protein
MTVLPSGVAVAIGARLPSAEPRRSAAETDPPEEDRLNAAPAEFGAD